LRPTSEPITQTIGACLCSQMLTDGRNLCLIHSVLDGLCCLVHWRNIGDDTLGNLPTTVTSSVYASSKLNSPLEHNIFSKPSNCATTSVFSVYTHTSDRWQVIRTPTPHHTADCNIKSWQTSRKKLRLLWATFIAANLVFYLNYFIFDIKKLFCTNLSKTVFYITQSPICNIYYYLATI
jgi:hypothetical protein